MKDAMPPGWSCDVDAIGYGGCSAAEIERMLLLRVRGSRMRRFYL